MTRERNHQITAAKNIILDAAEASGLLPKVAGRVASFSFLNIEADAVHGALVEAIASQQLCRVTVLSEDEILKHIQDYPKAEDDREAEAAE